MDVTTQGARPYELQSQPIQNLSERAIGEVFDVARNELQLARLEFDEKARAGMRAGQSFGLASIALVVALGSLAAAIVVGLASVMTLWSAMLAVAVIFGIIALILAMVGRATLSQAGGFTGGTILDRVAPPSGTTAQDATARTESAYEDLDRTVRLISQRNSNPSPVRDAVLAGIATMLSVVVQARNGRR
jgi:uncharacterized membrane protein YqjE